MTGDKDAGSHRGASDQGPKKPSQRQSLGRWGEQEAANYLHRQGYEIQASNHRTPYGEIDLIAWLSSADTMVFVEVKTRSTGAFGNPEEAVNPRKQAHLLSSAQYYIQQHPELTCQWRMDVIAIQRAGPGEPVQIIHFENAF
jgi:putative endonuclease